MKLISVLSVSCLFIWTLSLCSSVQAYDKVKIKEIQTLTFHSGTMTTGRRSAPVPQMSCVGGPAKGQPQPITAMCTNVGHDGHDVTWKCEADMPSNVRFGRTDVSCEGYDYPDDPYILRGSCGLEYTLEYTGSAPPPSSSWSSPPSSSYNTHYSNPVPSYRSPSSNMFSSLFMFVAVIGIFYMVFKACTQRGGVAGRVGGGGGGPGFGGGGGGGPGFGGYGGGYGGGGGFATGYGSSAGVFPARPAAAPGGGMGGFWGGMLGGGALGYLLGSRRNQHYNQGYGYGGNQFGGGNSFGAAPPPQQSYASGGLGSWGLNSGGGVATGTHHSTGFGGTRRR